MLYFALPSLGPGVYDTALGSFCFISHQKLNLVDLLLFQNIFHLPKYTDPAFLTLRSDLCIWSGYAVKGEAVELNMAGLNAT